MKKFTLFALLVFFITVASAQKDLGGYFSLRGGMAFKDDLKKGIAHMSMGISPNHIIGIGGGIGYINFDKPYIPLTIDISFFGKPGKVTPVVIGSAGYGIYSYNTPYSEVKGGFTGSLNVGLSMPVKKYSKFFVTGGYATYGFKGGSNVAINGNDIRSQSNIKMFMITAGFKI